MGPPPVPSLQPTHHQRSPPTSSGVQPQQHQQHQHQQPQPGYPAAPVGSVDERYSKRWRVDDGQSPSGLSVAQQQQQMAGYSTQQYQSQTPAHWYGSGTQPTNAPISQSPQPSYGYSSTSAGPSYSQHGHPAHAPMRNPAMYAAPISTAPSQWTSGIALKVKSNIIILGLPPTHSQRKLISSSRTPRSRTRQECTRSTLPLDPLVVVSDQSHALRLLWCPDLLPTVRLCRWI